MVYDETVYNETTDDILGTSDDIEKGYFDKVLKLPLGTREPYDSYPGVYPNKEIDLKKDVVYWYINLKEVFNIVMVSWAGTHKSVLLKRILRYCYRADYDCLCVDAKRDDMIEARRPVKEFVDPEIGKMPERLLNEEQPDSLPIVSCLPTFALMRKSKKRRLPNFIAKKFDIIFSPQITDLEEPIEWNTILGIKEVGADVMMKYKYLIDIEKISKKLDFDRNIHPGTKKSLKIRLDSINNDEVFDSKYPPLNIAKLWKDKLIPTIHFYSRSRRYMRYIVGDLYSQMRFYSEAINKPKLVICDDANFYAQNEEDYSTEMIRNALIHWRNYKFNQIFAVQNPSHIYEDIISDCKHLFVGRLGKPENIRPFVNDNIYNEIKNLRYDETNKPKINVEYIYVHPNKKTYDKFFPLGSMVYHSFGK